MIRADYKPAPILPRFSRQAQLLARGQEGFEFSAYLRAPLARSLEGLSPNEIQGLQAFVYEQFNEIQNDVNEFEETHGPDPDPKEIAQLAITRARLRGKQIERMIRNAHARQKMMSKGAEFFVWRSRKDDRTRPEHAALEGQEFPLLTGHPTEGFPGDAHGCRCTIGPAPSNGRGDEMTTHTRFDSFDLDLARATTTPEGWLEIKGAVLARAGVLTYALGGGGEVRELRDPAVMHTPAALASYDGKPLLCGGHPKDPATGEVTLLTAELTEAHPPVGSIRRPRADEAIDPSTGNTTPVTRADVLIWDRGAIGAARAGKRQFSCGYSVEIEEAPGEWRGDRYDQRQATDGGNHVALVDVARAGNITSFRMDRRSAVMTTRGGTMSPSPQGGPLMAKITIDGVTGEVEDALIPLITAAQTAAASTLTRADEQATLIETLKGELKVLNAAAEARGDDEDRLNAAVTARLALQVEAGALLPSGYEFSGKGDDEIRGDAVKQATGLEGLEGAQLEGAYQTALSLTKRATSGQHALAAATRPTHRADSNGGRMGGLEGAYARFCARHTNTATSKEG